MDRKKICTISRIALVLGVSVLAVFSLIPSNKALAATANASCSAQINVQPGDTVQWQATVDNGSGVVTYSWTGTDGLSGSSDAVTTTYNLGGNKNATANVTRTTTGSNVSISCTIDVISITHAVNAPTVNLTIDGQTSLTTTQGATSTATWQTTNSPDSCNAFGAWSGSKNVAGGTEQIVFNILGTQTYGLSCTNAGGSATSTVSVTVNAASTTPTNTKPVITLLGSSPMNVTQGTTFTDPGATAFDTEDGNLTSQIVVTGTVDTNVLGTTTISYNVTDSHGLAADTVTREVNIVLGGGGGSTTATSTCSTSLSVTAGQTVEWSATVVGSPTPVLSWSGTDSLSGSLATVTKTYSTSGAKTGTITATATGSSPSITSCNVTAHIVNQCLLPEFTSLLSVNATTGSFFSYTLTATSTNSTLTLATSTLPAGLSYATTTNTISGTPTQTGTFTISITATNGCGTTSGSLVITVGSGGGGGGNTGSISFCKLFLNSNGNIATSTTAFPADSFSIALATSPNIASSTVRTANFNTTGFTPNTALIGGQANAMCTSFTNMPFGRYYYGEEHAGTLGLWLTPKYNDQFVIGTSTTTDFYTYDSAFLNATSTTGLVWNEKADGVIDVSATSTTPYVMVLNQPSPAPICQIPNFTSSLTASVTVNQSFSYTLTATSTATSSISYNVATSTLPAGLSYATTTNTISGTPTQNGTYTIPLMATNSCGTKTANLILTVSGGGGGGSCPLPTFTSSLSVTATRNQSFNYLLEAISANGGGITYNVTSSLPDGLTYNSSTHTISGTPTVSGIFSINLSANGYCGTGTNTLVITIGGGGGGGGGGGSESLIITNERVSEIEPGVVFVQWDTNLAASGQVFYGTNSVSNTNLSDISSNLGYQNQTNKVISPILSVHTMAIFGLNLNSGQTFYFRPVSATGGLQAIGKELSFRKSTPPVVASCQYLYDYLKIGANNNPVEVRKLQVFLRDFEGNNSVSVTGFFDQTTFNAVEAFQKKYGQDILTPWGYQVDEPTGYVYILTKKKVNELYCERAFPVTPLQQSEIDAFNIFLQSLEQAGIPVSNGTVAPATTTATTTPSGVIENGLVGLGNSVATTTSNNFLANVAASALAFPTTFNEFSACVAIFILVLILVYILGTLAAYALGDEDNRDQISLRTRKLISFSVGILIALIISIFVSVMSCQIIPLLVIFILLVAATAWYANKKSTDESDNDGDDDLPDNNETTTPIFIPSIQDTTSNDEDENEEFFVDEEMSTPPLEEEKNN